MRNIINLANNLYDYLERNNISFNEYGYPIFPKHMLLSEYPEDMITFYNRHYSSAEKSKTVICSYTNDSDIYTRLSMLDNDIEIYKEYMGICGFDLSPRITWDINLQRFNILLSQMATIYLGLHGIKIFPNFRTGTWNTINSLAGYPLGSTFAIGSLGCANGYVELNKTFLKEKLVYALPSKVLIYGILKPEYKKILDDYDVMYRVYSDFQRKSRSRKKVA